jgi:hypothetical protein
MTDTNQQPIAIPSKAALLRFAKTPGARLQQLAIFRRGDEWSAYPGQKLPNDIKAPRPVGRVQTNALTLLTTPQNGDPFHSWIYLNPGQKVQGNGDGTFDISLEEPPASGEWTDFMRYRPSIAA